MKTIALLILASVAWIAWVVTALAVEHHQERLQGAGVVNADYQRCITISPGPIQRPRGILGTRRSDRV